jgi:hypothetical protein
MDNAFFKYSKQATCVWYILSSVHPQRKTSMGVKYGNPAGHVTCPPIPIHLVGNGVQKLSKQVNFIVVVGKKLSV